jgi:hypothetical protein
MKSSIRVALARPQTILWLAGLLLATDALMALFSTTAGPSQPSHPCVASSAAHTAKTGCSTPDTSCLTNSNTDSFEADSQSCAALRHAASSTVGSGGERLYEDLETATDTHTVSLLLSLGRSAMGRKL